jgi:DNA-binding transcriptional regulator YdaS (Cro superfamily)
MDIKTYLKRKKLSQKAFADKVGVTPGAVWQWLNGESKVSHRVARQIEEATDGEIQRAELRPDIYA